MKQAFYFRPRSVSIQQANAAPPPPPLALGELPPFSPPPPTATPPPSSPHLPILNFATLLSLSLSRARATEREGACFPLSKRKVSKAAAAATTAEGGREGKKSFYGKGKDVRKRKIRRQRRGGGGEGRVGGLGREHDIKLAGMRRPPPPSFGFGGEANPSPPPPVPYIVFLVYTSIHGGGGSGAWQEAKKKFPNLIFPHLSHPSISSFFFLTLFAGGLRKLHVQTCPPPANSFPPQTGGPPPPASQM